jgi:hypothetical protein
MLAILRDITGPIHITDLLFMVLDITIDLGIIPITTRDQLLMDLGFIIIHGLDGDIHLE